MWPMAFFREFVCPAIEFWRERPSSTVLAACAIAQLDILAEVVAIAEADGTPTRDGATIYRDDLGGREVAYARIRNAHDSHKHGRLSRKTAAHISKGQRPYPSRGTAFFAGASYVGDPMGTVSTAVILDDGTSIDVGVLLQEGLDVWEQELRRLGYWIEPPKKFTVPPLDPITN